MSGPGNSLLALARMISEGGLTLAAFALLWVGALSYFRHWWQLPFLAKHRRYPMLLTGGGAALISCAVSWLLLGPGHIHAVAFVTLAIAPWACFHLVNIWSWWTDGPAIRQAAAELRILEASRLDEAEPSTDQRLPWSSYVFDVERAARRAAYEPPPI